MLLCIETSGTVCSVAIFKDSELLSYSELAVERSHAEMLTTLIEHVVKQAQTKLKQLSAVAVSAGPGSYTGLRIGVSTAKGLCFALQIPLYAVNTLYSMVAQATGVVPSGYEHILLCPMLDARRTEVYMALYKNDLSELISPQPHILSEESLSHYRDQEIWLMGSGADKAWQLLRQHHTGLRLLRNQHPSARAMGALVAQNPTPVDLAYFEPEYLKPFMGTPKSKATLL